MTEWIEFETISTFSPFICLHFGSNTQSERVRALVHSLVIWLLHLRVLYSSSLITFSFGTHILRSISCEWCAHSRIHVRSRLTTIKAYFLSFIKHWTGSEERNAPLKTYQMMLNRCVGGIEARPIHLIDLKKRRHWEREREKKTRCWRRWCAQYTVQTSRASKRNYMS